MALVLVRVDCRLIHGQVIEAWVPHTGADTVVVINDEAAEDALQRTIMTMAVPPNIDVYIMTLEDSIRSLTAGRWREKKAVVLFSNLKDLVICHRAGVRFDHVNIGNLVCAPGKTQVTCSISLDQNDIAYLEELQDAGVIIDVRTVPRERSSDLGQLVRCCQYG